MPNPGDKVNEPEFDGKLRGIFLNNTKIIISNCIIFTIDVEKDFKINVQKFVESIFAQPITCKEIYGQSITSSALFEYFKVSFKTINLVADD